MNNTPRRARLWACVLITATAALLLLIPLPCLVAADPDSGPVLIIPMPVGKTFTLGYIHSVHKTPVEENFILDTGTGPARLVLTSTSFDTLGVGIPYGRGEGNLEHQQGRFMLTGLHREFEEINVKAMPLAQHSLTVRGRHYDLNDYFAPGASLRLKADRLSTLEIIGRRLFL